MTRRIISISERANAKDRTSGGEGRAGREDRKAEGRPRPAQELILQYMNGNPYRVIERCILK